jgi:hypothetical protein
MKLTEQEVLDINQSLSLSQERLEQQKDELCATASTELAFSLHCQFMDEFDSKEELKYSVNSKFLKDNYTLEQLNLMMTDFISKMYNQKLPF